MSDRFAAIAPVAGVLGIPSCAPSRCRSSSSNGGLTWPGSTPVPTLGYTTTYLSSTDAMWSVFQAHPRS